MSEASLIPNEAIVSDRLTRRRADFDYYKRLRNAVNARIAADPAGPDPAVLFPSIGDLDAAIEQARTGIELLTQQQKLSAKQAEITAKLNGKAETAAVSLPVEPTTPAARPEPEAPPAVVKAPKPEPRAAAKS